MNLKELKSPIRMYWDLPETASDPGPYLNVCEEILVLKILYLSLRDLSAPISPACTGILDRLKGKNLALSLTLSGPALVPSRPAGLSNAAIKTLLVNVSSFSEVRSLFENRALDHNVGPLAGISFDVGKDNYREIPDVVSFCLGNGIRDLVFPIQRLTGARDVFCLAEKERTELIERLGALDHRAIRLTIHDPFLWQVFYPDIDYHEGGCQAANSMLYVSPDLIVYPCPAMPVLLGDLHDTTLREIIQSEKKKELRRSLLDPPGECALCGRAGACLGGCRGRAFAALSSLDKRDPACTPI